MEEKSTTITAIIFAAMAVVCLCLTLSSLQASASQSKYSAQSIASPIRVNIFQNIQDRTAEYISQRKADQLAQGSISNKKSFLYEKTEPVFKIINLAFALSKDLSGQNKASLINIREMRYADTSTIEDKYLEVDLSDQTVTLYQYGQNIGSFLVSTGSAVTPTPVGTFRIFGKKELGYTSTYGVYLPFWMQFTAIGHGFHSLPYGADGQPTDEDKLGQPVSHGCIRLSEEDAEKIYRWSDINTKVIIYE